MDFNIQLRSGKKGTARPARLVAYSKAHFNNPDGRFVYPTGITAAHTKAPQLKELKKLAGDAYESLEREGKPVNEVSLRGRIDLLRKQIAWTDNELTIWDKHKKVVEYYHTPDGFDQKALEDSLQKELTKSKPEFKKVIDSVLTDGANTLFGFWQSILDGKTKPRYGKALRPSSISVKRQTLRVVKEFDPTTAFEKMDMTFYNNFTSWLETQVIRKENDKGKVEVINRFDSNTIGKHIRQLKSILHLAYRNELMQQDRFKYWPVLRESNEVITLSKDEVLKVNSIELSGTKDDVRDIFVLACFLGPRISDFKSFKKESLDTKAGVTTFEYVQEKTGARVKVPVHSIALKILDKRGGEFPRMISEQNFRSHLKEICKAAGLNDRVTVKIRNGKPEYKKKWEAISPHSARRTFASALFFGWFNRDKEGKEKPMPAVYCMACTGHKTEKSFLLYIGAKKEDIDKQIQAYFFAEPQMKVS